MHNPEKTALQLTAAVVLVVGNVIMGHFAPPLEIFLSPVVTSVTTLITVIALVNTPYVWSAVMSYIYIAINDLGIKLYGGGNHDSEGSGWINAFLLISLGCSGIILLLCMGHNKQSKWPVKTLSVILFVLLGCAHLYLFGLVGEGRYY